MNHWKYNIILIIITIGWSFSLKAQYLNTDRVSITSGIALNGIILEDHKPDYLLFESEEYGSVKIKYKDLKYVLKRADANDPFYKKGAHQYFAAGMGYGAEYGGIGTRLQLRVGRKVGFAHFIGFGSAEYQDWDQSKKEMVMSMVTGVKFYPYEYFFIGAGLQFEPPAFFEADGFVFMGMDWPIVKFLIINASVGYQADRYFSYPTENLMLNIGISYKLTLVSVKPSSKKGE